MIIYVIYNEITKLTKIGITENLHRRVGELERAGGESLHIISWADIPHAPEMEKFLHATFSDYRRQGEWFSLDSQSKKFLCNIWLTYFNDSIRKDDNYIFAYKVPVYEDTTIMFDLTAYGLGIKKELSLAV